MDEPEVDLRGAMGVLRRQLRTIVVTLILGLGIAGAALFVLKPVYTATALVLVDPSNKDLLNPDQQLSNLSSDSARVDSEVELVASESALLTTIKDLNLVDDPEFGTSIGLQDRILAFLRIAEPKLPTGDEALQKIVTKLRSAVSVQRRGLTYLIAVQARSADPEIAAKIVNAITGAYIREQLDFKVQATQASRDAIQARLADAAAAVSKSEESFDSFISSNLEAISAQTGATDLLALRQRLDTITQARQQDLSTLQLAETSLASQDWTGVASTLKSQALNKLETDRANLEKLLSGLAADDATAVDLKSQLTNLDQQLNRVATGEVTTLRQQVAASQSQLSDLRNQLRSSVLQADLPADMLTSLYALQQSSENARTQYQTLLSRGNTLDTQAFLQVPDSRVVAQGLPPSEPSFPEPRLILILAAVGSLVIGVGLAFLVENYIGGFTSTGQLEAVLGAHAAVPVPRQRQSGKKSIADQVVDAPLSIYAEAIRRVRLSVEQAIGPRRPSIAGRGRGAVVMVSSSVPGEGKTTLALSLARAYALAGQATLVIDCDLRRPSIHRELGIEPMPDLIEYLAASGEKPPIEDLIRKDRVTAAKVIVGARRSDMPTDQLVSGTTFLQLLDAARARFDVIVLDTPPVGPVTDGLYVAAMADAIVFAVRYSMTPQREARTAMRTIVGAKQPTTGVIQVLNQTRTPNRGYRARYSDYYAST
jgi:succinoglycan biosynthesis transport protein ExoP